MAMYERIRLMEERIPMNPRPPSSASRAEQQQRETLDEGRLDLLEHLISTVLQGKSTYLQAMLQHEEILDVLDLHDNKGFTALHIASERVDATAIRILLLAGANPNVLDRFSRSALHWVVSGGCHCDVCNTERGTCAALLLDAKAHVDPEDLKGETPLAYAARNRFQKAGLVILEHGADMSKLSKGVKLSHLIVQKIPDVMTELLDASISYDEEDNSKLKLDFGVLLDSAVIGAPDTGNKDGADDGGVWFRTGPERETELLCAMLSAHEVAREELLTHPLTEAFLHIKWTYVKKWFWFLRFFYSSLILVYTYFVFNLYLVTCPYSPDKTEDSPECSPDLELFILGTCIGVCVILMLLGEMYEMFRSPRSYLKSGTNWGWWLLAIAISLTLLPAFRIPIMDWQHTLAALTLFFAWAMNLAHISRIPYFGAYVEMLGKVLRKLIIVFFTYFSLFAAFVLGFWILFPKTEFFSSIPKSLFKVFMMTIGDRDYPGVFNATQETRLNSLEYSIPAHFFYTVFLIVFGIVLMNLLMALAVSDIQELERKAELSLVVKEIREMTVLESFLASKLFSRCLTNCFLSRISVRRRNGRYFRFSATEAENQSLPSDLKRKFIPYLYTRSCLKKRGAGRRNLRTPNGLSQRLNLRSSIRGVQPGPIHHSDNLEDILNELRQRLEGLQRRNIQY